MRSLSVSDRFWAKVDKKAPSECWEWTAYKDKKYGYGRFGVTPKDIRWAHRYAYELIHGEIPKGMFILHSCDNPKCVNPNHLRAGTHAENMKDASDRHRLSGQATMSREQVEELRELAFAGTKFSDLALKYGLSEGHIRSICRGDFRPDAGGPLTKIRGEYKKVGLIEARQIRILYQDGVKQIDIAKQFGCSPQCVNGIIKNRVYKE